VIQGRPGNEGRGRAVRLLPDDTTLSLERRYHHEERLSLLSFSGLTGESRAERIGVAVFRLDPTVEPGDDEMVAGG